MPETIRNTKSAFTWIVHLLQTLHLPFHIAGGLAARVYGSTRELADIDIDIPESAFAQLVPYVKDYIVFGPQQYTDSSWDLLLMTLNYEGQDIDVAGAEHTKIFDQNILSWVPAPTNFSNDTVMQVFGSAVPIMHKDELLNYKYKLRREVDLKDIEALSKG